MTLLAHQGRRSNKPRQQRPLAGELHTRQSPLPRPPLCPVAVVLRNYCGAGSRARFMLLALVLGAFGSNRALIPGAFAQLGRPVADVLALESWGSVLMILKLEVRLRFTTAS